MNSQPQCVCFANDMQIPSMESTFLQEREVAILGPFPVSFRARLCRCRRTAFCLTKMEFGELRWFCGKRLRVHTSPLGILVNKLLRSLFIKVQTLNKELCDGVFQNLI